MEQMFRHIKQINLLILNYVEPLFSVLLTDHLNPKYIPDTITSPRPVQLVDDDRHSLSHGNLFDVIKAENIW